MRLLFVADGRSAIALNWIRYFVQGGHEVHLVSTFACNPPLDLASCTVVPAAFSGAVVPLGSTHKSHRTRPWQRRVLPVGLRTSLRQWFGPLTLPRAAGKLDRVIDQFQPDLVHALRIPYEGMLAALAKSDKQSVYFPPLLVSVWGNDFTLHARANPWMAYLTRLVLTRADALHSDCYRDQRLAQQWGFATDKAAVVLPGGGGVQSDLFYPGETQRPGWVINPRGMRAYVRNDTFFRAVPLVLAQYPEASFLCPAMAGEARAMRWVTRLGIRHAVELLPQQSRFEMAALFRRSQVAVSPATHDGTPNTLLEAMSSGCFPIAGDLESLREWITDGENGLLIDPGNHHALAKAILQALQDTRLRSTAQAYNTRLVAERADYRRVMGEAETFYTSLIHKASS